MDAVDSICPPLVARKTATRVLLKTYYSANGRIELVEQPSNEHTVLAHRVIGDLAERIRRDDQRLLGALIGASPWE